VLLYVVVESANCLKLPDNVDYEEGSFTDPVSVGLHAVRKCRMEAGKTAAVFGLGAIGFICVQWLRALGCTKVIAVDVADDKLALAKRLGATAGVNGMKTDAVAAIKELTGGEGVDIAIEFAGNKITHVQAVASCKKNGEVVYGGITYDDVTYPNKVIQAILRGELTIHGSWNSSINPLPINEWKSGLEFMSTGQMNVNPLITHRVRLEDCKEVFEMMFNRTEVFTKVLFKPEM
jgi:L-iditol 2-dehydrogenase